jgi:hypothetical protein
VRAAWGGGDRGEALVIMWWARQHEDHVSDYLPKKG